MQNDEQKFVEIKESKAELSSWREYELGKERKQSRRSSGSSGYEQSDETQSLMPTVKRKIRSVLNHAQKVKIVDAIKRNVSENLLNVLQKAVGMKLDVDDFRDELEAAKVTFTSLLF